MSAAMAALGSWDLNAFQIQKQQLSMAPPHPSHSEQLDLNSQITHRLQLRNIQTPQIPRNRLSEQGLPGDLSYQLVHDHLMLDGNARLNLATFVGTWMEPEARRLMEECAEKNMIDKDEYPQTAELEERCLRILADLWHAPDPETAIGTSTTGSSEGCMLGGLGACRAYPHHPLPHRRPSICPDPSDSNGSRRENGP